jgi:thiamine transport system ATP-binding protein
VFLGYPTVVTGAAAARLAAAAGASGVWTAVALRRSALRADAAGPVTATVLAARVTPDQLRLSVSIEGVGDVEAVADPGADLAVGQQVRLAVDTSRLAVLATG